MLNLAFLVKVEGLWVLTELALDYGCTTNRAVTHTTGRVTLSKLLDSSGASSLVGVELL